MKYQGVEGARRLIAAQERGIRKISALGALVKINMVLVPGINDGHVEAVAQAVKAWAAAEAYLPVFRHCQRCRADACGIPGKSDVSGKLYQFRQACTTFSHG